MSLSNDYLLAAALGVIEGLTEFLPVSSTAHLRVFEALAGVDLADPYWKMFSVVIQLGAILSLPIYFFKTLRDFVAHFPKGPRGGHSITTHPATLVGVAFVCTLVPAFLMTKLIGENLESLTIMGAALVAGGVVMWAVDVIYSRASRRHTESIDDTRLAQAVTVGLCQTLAAVFPGTSRSMATIASGQIAGMSRPVALEFSFLLSIPTMCAATGYDLFKTVRSGEARIDSHGIVLLAIGLVVSFAVAYAVVAWFMHWVRKHGFVPFAIYRIAAGAAILLFMGK